MCFTLTARYLVRYVDYVVGFLGTILITCLLAQSSTFPTVHIKLNVNQKNHHCPSEASQGRRQEEAGYI